MLLPLLVVFIVPMRDAFPSMGCLTHADLFFFNSNKDPRLVSELVNEPAKRTSSVRCDAHALHAAEVRQAPEAVPCKRNHFAVSSRVGPMQV